MKLSKSATRYAKALLTFAVERNELDTVNADIKAIQTAITGSKELATMMSSAVIQEEQKVAIYKKIFADKVSATTLKFMILIAKNSRSSILPHIINAFEKQYKTYMKIVPVNISTARKMDEGLKQELVSFLSKDNPGTTIEITENIKEDLIGGFIFRTDTHQIDASVSNRLKALKRDLYNTTYTSKL